MMWFSDGRRLLAIAIVFATLVGAWMFRYETIGPHQMYQVNRFTGVICNRLSQVSEGVKECLLPSKGYDVDQWQPVANR
jgi:hypothetical protein